MTMPARSSVGPPSLGTPDKLPFMAWATSPSDGGSGKHFCSGRGIRFLTEADEAGCHRRSSYLQSTQDRKTDGMAKPLGTAEHHYISVTESDRR